VEGDQREVLGGWFGVVVAVAIRPRLWFTALVQAVRMVPSGWWRTGSHLPGPSAAYVRFRTVTATGDPSRSPDPSDVIVWLEWCRAWRRADY
jgi:hypothetical protein